MGAQAGVAKLDKSNPAEAAKSNLRMMSLRMVAESLSGLLCVNFKTSAWSFLEPENLLGKSSWRNGYGVGIYTAATSASLSPLPETLVRRDTAVECDRGVFCSSR